MEYVATLLNCDVDPAAWARRREDEGWDVLGCADHLFSPRRAYPHLWVTLATFAAATSRPMLTSSFANNLLRTPVEFAQAALQMQAVSSGRFEAGLGAGWDETEIIGAGLEYPPPAHEPAAMRRPSRSCASFSKRVPANSTASSTTSTSRRSGRASTAPTDRRVARWSPHDQGDCAARRSGRAQARQHGHEGWRARRGRPRLDPAQEPRRTRGEGPGRQPDGAARRDGDLQCRRRRTHERHRGLARRLLHGRVLRFTREGRRVTRRPRRGWHHSHPAEPVLGRCRSTCSLRDCSVGEVSADSAHG